jgi:hypothetical protein
LYFDNSLANQGRENSTIICSYSGNCLAAEKKLKKMLKKTSTMTKIAVVSRSAKRQSCVCLQQQIIYAKGLRSKIFYCYNLASAARTIHGSLFFYRLDQIACVGACVGEIKKQVRRLRSG